MVGSFYISISGLTLSDDVVPWVFCWNRSSCMSKRDSEGYVFRMRPQKPRSCDLCYSKCVTIKIPPFSKAISAEIYIAKILHPFTELVTYPQERNFLKRDFKNRQTK